MIYAYIRYSSENQRDGVSIESQRTAIVSFVKSQQELRDQSIVERIDEAKSATTLRGREALALIRAEAATGDVVIVYKLDRLARNLFEALKVLKDFEERRVKVLSTCEPAMPLVQHVLLAMSEEFSRQLSDRCKRALDHCAKSGYAANRAAYGYKIVREGERARYHVDAERAEIVRKIFRWRADGLSFLDIVHRLNGDSIPSPRGGLWYRSCISNMLQNETYLGTTISGYRHFKKGIGLVGKRSRQDWALKRNAHEAIITQELWDGVRNRDSQRRTRNHTPQTRAKFLLTGFLRCAHCGANLVVDSCKSVKYYGCAAGRETGRKLPCTRRFLIRKDVAERFVVQTLIQSVYNDDFIADVVRLCREEIKRATDESSPVLPGLQRQLNRLEAQVETAERRMVVIPEDSLPVFLNELQTLKTERDDLRARIALATGPKPSAPDLRDLERRLRERILDIEREIAGPDIAKARTLLASTVERIDVTKTKEATLIPKVASELRVELKNIPTGI